MSHTTFKPKIGITTGDINGIGIELIIRAFSEHRLLELCTPIVFASNKAINFYKQLIGENNVQYSGTKDLSVLQPKGINVFNCWDEEISITPGQINEIGGKYGVRSLMVATQCLKDGQLDGLLTNPIHKGNSQTQDFKYSGHTPFLKEKFAAKDVAMLMCGEDLKVALLTEHLPISEVAKNITTEAIVSKCRILHETLIKDFGLDKPKIAVLALNPHASDNGLIGNEEQTIIIPAIEKLRNEHILAFGPYSADAFFARENDRNFDCVLAMYHDQGLIPFKSFDKGMGVNYTAGLPVVRTSPDHGTAFDIAGKNCANANSFIEALYLCIDILHQRKGYQENTKNRLQKGKWNSLKRSKEDIVE
ncbi:MAG TPA: 4-hydroxythreonine-4-phosphate dehydrogenase PdxA [Chitinophagaceae bacterium]|nr:4-hydroxythreonine-4-phosphate dehydrogenase PdxA [Chitinophagaceae bacterium]